MPRPAVATVSTRASLGAIELLDDSQRRAGQVGLVEDHDGGNLPALQLVEHGLLERSPLAGVDDHSPRSVRSKTWRVFSHALFAQGADVVDAGGVDEEHRPQRQQFHRLFHRIGGGAGHVGDDGDLLPGQGIEQRRLARIAAAEQADVQAETFGGGLHGLASRPIRGPARQLGKRSARLARAKCAGSYSLNGSFPRASAASLFLVLHLLVDRFSDGRSIVAAHVLHGHHDHSSAFH